MDKEEYKLKVEFWTVFVNDLMKGVTNDPSLLDETYTPAAFKNYINNVYGNLEAVKAFNEGYQVASMMTIHEPTDQIFNNADGEPIGVKLEKAPKANCKVC